MCLFNFVYRHILNLIILHLLLICVQGFSVGYVPLGSRLGGMICPVLLSQCGSRKKNLAKLAIKGYNEENAKDGKPGSHPQNFQTRVYQCIEKTEVQFCRLEQKKSTLPEAGTATDSDVHECSLHCRNINSGSLHKDP
ncbi:uncharacterized protein LOC131331095 isoform X2 [Rhododendron vialii]|uniref:uncharacterized protein LOC131331095 isoform X2 n=1 Tax=Rhododendron vialii TaxID=182163 RepID=UPI00265E2B21|nr:uncharacterized protein LOC131331095 isoform X2 [Rhododendron vialii]